MALTSSTIDAYKEFLNQLEETYKVFNINNAFVWIVGFVFSVLLAIFNNFLIVGSYIAVMFASRKNYRRKLDETDFEKNKNLYRDIIENYSVSELNYIDKFKLDKKQSYTAKLLELQKKKIIEIKNDKINVIGEARDRIDKAFIGSIKNNKVTMPLNEYERLVISENLEKKLIEKPSGLNLFKDIKGIMFLVVIMFLISGVVFFFVSNVSFEEVLEKYFVLFILTFLAFEYFLVFGFIYFFALIFKTASEPNYKRTKKGKEINRQLDGLKLFMEEFSNIENKEAKHLVLWEEYLMYSVMFNINKKIQDEYSKYFN